ncbi:MAG TPA: outer membrane protein transport protein, partial [Vicinamibacteria bacterium]|nr:outer membrane protein transport protein [Vicinamibacteria bacterium]
ISRLARLTAVSLNPTLAYAASPRLALGAGLDLRVTRVELERVVPLQSPFTGAVLDIAAARLESDTGLAAGFNLGLLARPTDALSIGLAYRHKVTAGLDGQATFTLLPTGEPGVDAIAAAALPRAAVPLRTALAFPAIASLGVAHRFGPWTAEVDVNWYQWSTFRSVDLAFSGRPDLDQSIVEDYEDTLQYRFGVERRLNPTWRVRAGYYFDHSPAPAASVSPLLPDPDRHCFALGASWDRGRVRVDAAGQYVLGRDRSTEGVNRDGFDGTYSNTGFVLSLFAGYRF